MEVRPEYDPLLVKLLVHAADRPAAVARLRRALDETFIGGLQTDAGFLRWLVDDAAFVSGVYDTGLIADRWGSGPALSDAEQALVAFAAAEARRQEAVPRRAAGGRPASAWAEVARREAVDP